MYEPTISNVLSWSSDARVRCRGKNSARMDLREGDGFIIYTVVE